MAGPDHLPYEAWRCFGEVAVDTLFEAGQAMQHPDFPTHIRETYSLHPDEAHPFNLGTLVCLPKKPVAHHHEVGDVYTPGGIRPFSIVDNFNRILANAFRHRWEPHLAQWISPAQRGFLPGRSILANVVDIEEAFVLAALQEDESAVFLFDFAAAFPPVSQDFFLRALERIGLPPHALHAIRALYDNNRCRPAFGGQLWGGFQQEVGIRQGCPLSPLLFAAIVDPFLRLLQRKLPGQLICAYADDTAAVVRDVQTAAPTLTREFRRFARVANVVLNVPKTVCIPLWTTTMENVRSKLVSIDASSEQVQVAATGKYLGYFTGPGKGQQSWYGAGAKMISRVRQWPWNRLGLYYAMCAYNLYASSLPTYIAQLEPYPEEFRAIEHSRMLPWDRTPGHYHRISSGSLRPGGEFP